MGTVVQTVATCDKCGVTKISKGAEGEIPPVGWGHVRLNVRAEGAGWSGQTRTTAAMLCASCSDDVRLAIAGPNTTHAGA